MIANIYFSTNILRMTVLLFKDLIITLVQFIIIDVGIALRDLDIFVPGQCLCQFEISGSTQDR